MKTTSETAPKGSSIGDRTSDHAGPGPDVMAAATLVGDSVRNIAVEDLGKLEDIMLDVRRGRVAYAVLSFGGFLTIGSKLFAIPCSALTLDTDDECFILDVPKERLKNAPGFDKDHWPSSSRTEVSTRTEFSQQQVTGQSINLGNPTDKMRQPDGTKQQDRMVRSHQ